MSRRTGAVLAVLGVGAMLVIIDATVVNVALETLSLQFDASLDQVQWVITAYLLALGVAIPVTAWLAGIVGARRLWLMATGLFVVASVLAAAAGSLGMLIACRVLQGAGGGMIAPLGYVLAVRQAGGRDMTQLISTMNMPVLVGPALGPVIAGALVGSFGWRSLFLINVPIGLAALVLGRRVLPEVPRERRGRLDVVGLVLLPAGVLALLLGAARLGNADGFALLAAGPLLLLAFWRHAARFGRDAALRVQLLRSGPMWRSATAMFVTNGVHLGALAVLPLYFLVVRDASILTAGVLVGVQGVGSAIGLFAAGRLAGRFGSLWLVRRGQAVATLATVPLALVSDHTPYAVLVVALLVRGAGISATLSPLHASVYETLPPGDVSHATTILNTLARVGGAFGVALALLLTEHQIVASAGRTGALAEKMGITFALLGAVTAANFVLTLTIRDPGRRATPQTISGYPRSPSRGPERRAHD